MIDTGRRFLPMATIRKIIDGLAMNKLNVLHWHMSDSQSWPSESALFPGLADEGAYHPSAVYSIEAMRSLVRYALQRGVRITPEWDIPGHFNQHAMDGASLSPGCKGTNAGLFGAVLDPTQKFYLRIFVELPQRDGVHLLGSIRQEQRQRLVHSDLPRCRIPVTTV
eukprot:SAG31_NODE_14081_length_828_cov_1.063100_1_plen_166_part_00